MVYLVFLLLASSRLVTGQDDPDPLPTSIAQPNTSMSQTEETVGWVGNPRQRGTLMLLIECLTTIFACTWTVLHLNLPSPKDTAIIRVIRKIKWMAVTIIFPEFIFAKAVCELRYALRTHRLISQKMNSHPEAYRSIAEYKPGEPGMFGVVWSWKAENGRVIEWLCKLLLGRRQSKWNERQPSGYVERGEHLPEMKWASITQIWTVSHSYYLNMGGMYGLNCTDEQHLGFCNPTFFVIREEYLTNLDFKEIRLSEEDIKDKSKADWIGKTLAILQIGRLGLDVINRAVSHRPITQIELATMAFAIFAIVTYLINWWKPKDVSEPTLLHTSVKEKNSPSVIASSLEPFVTRLLFPLLHAAPPTSDWGQNRERIANDEVWMDGRIPLIWPLMAVSCLVFGGFHCIAWSFQFPTEIEQLVWRIASLTSMFLPVIALAGTFWIMHSHNGSLTNHQIPAAHEVVNAIEALQGKTLPQDLELTSIANIPRRSRFVQLEDIFVEILKNELYPYGSFEVAVLTDVLSRLKISKPGSKPQIEGLNRFSVWDSLHTPAMRNLIDYCWPYMGPE